MEEENKKAKTIEDFMGHTNEKIVNDNKDSKDENNSDDELRWTISGILFWVFLSLTIICIIAHTRGLISGNYGRLDYRVLTNLFGILTGLCFFIWLIVKISKNTVRTEIQTNKTSEIEAQNKKIEELEKQILELKNNKRDE